MNVTNNLPVFDHSSFGLNEDGQVADQAKFCLGLQVLIDQPLEAIRKPQLVERVFKTISEADLASWPEAEKVVKLVKSVRDHWVKVSLGDSFRHVPRVRLQNDCGPKFKQQFRDKFAEASKHELELSLPENGTSQNYPARLTESFLSQLQTGEVSKDGFDENVLDLLSLALLHTQEPLIVGCVNFLSENLDVEDLDLPFTYANEQNCHPLKWACLRFMQENLEEIPKVLQDKYQVQFQVAKSLQDKGITLRFSPSGQTEILIKNLPIETTTLLEQINKVIPIHSLVIPQTCTADPLPLLEEVAPHLPELQELIIYNEETTDQEIPTLKKLFPKLTAFGNDSPFLKTFEEVETYLHNFTKPGTAEPREETITLRSLNLKSINTLDDSQMNEVTKYLEEIYLLVIHCKTTSLLAPKATKIICTGCVELATLVAPNARSINCSGCAALTTLEAPKATMINCQFCKTLTTLEAPEATQINCYECRALKTLVAPKATQIICQSCTRLTSLQIPKARKIICRECTVLTTLDVPNATEIYSPWCKALTTLKAPQATSIDCTGCEALETLKAPKATKISCYRCTALIILDAPNANSIDCRCCEALTTLQAPNTTWIHCSDCTTLTTLKLPLATTVGCSSCEALTTLEAPNANSIDCSGCAVFTTLQVPLADKVDCHNCTVLTTLEAPQAKLIECYKCAALTTLRAPNAREIICTGCVALTTLDAPNANLIRCFECNALTTLNAPKATSIQCSGCTTLTTLKVPNATEVECRGCEALTTLELFTETGIDLTELKGLTTLKVLGTTDVNCSECKALSTLDAPNATGVYCENCTALTTLRAPNAREIFCTGCVALTTLNAPKATLTGESRIRIWSRGFWNQIRSSWNAVLVFLVWVKNRLLSDINALFRR